MTAAEDPLLTELRSVMGARDPSAVTVDWVQRKLRVGSGTAGRLRQALIFEAEHQGFPGVPDRPTTP